jgi:DNA-binding transcriptional ArsR family regulator
MVTLDKIRLTGLLRKKPRQRGFFYAWGASSHVRAILKGMLKQSVLVDPVFHALAHPTRRVIVERLSRGPASVSELAQPLDTTLPAVVQHLAVLEASGLVRSEKTGRVRTCCIEPLALRTAEEWIAERRATWERRLDRLGDYLAEDHDHHEKGD